MIVFDFNRWLASDSVIADLLDTASGETTFLPIQDEPEETGAFVVYEFEKRTSEMTWLVEKITLTYEIRSFSYDDTVAVDERMSRLTESPHSWRRFQAWADANAQRDYTVQRISQVYSGDMAAPMQEGGKYGRIVVFELEYTPLEYIE